MKIFTVDSFTSEPFKGNPAGVCVLDKALSDESYLKIAREINYAETAFVIKSESGFNLRWFTPTVEVDLCGHATLAAAKILFDKFNYSQETISFYTRSGELTVKQIDGCLLEMNFPSKITSAKTINSLLSEFVNDEVLYYGEEGIWAFVEVESEVKRLALRARDGQITIDEMTGGTFTITNGGVFGSMLSTPIINPPQSGILGMHNIVNRPMAVNGEVVIQPIMYVALSYDHRIVDGRESVGFLVAVKEALENPVELLMDNNPEKALEM